MEKSFCSRNVQFLPDNTLADTSHIRHHTSTEQHTKLYQKLSGQLTQGSLFYNIMILSVFSINIAHFCFPFLIQKNGIIAFFIVLSISCLMSYFIQQHLILLLKTEKSETHKINYSVLIEKNFGELCTYLMNVIVIIWYSNLLLIVFMTCNETLILDKKFLCNFLLEDTEKDDLVLYEEIMIYCVLIVLLSTFNYSNNLKIIYFDLIFGFFNNLLTLILTLVNSIKNNDVTQKPWTGNADQSIFDLINLNSCSFGTIIIFFWVTFKLSENTMKKDYNKLILFPLVIVFLFYLAYVIITVYSLQDMEFKQSKFLLFQSIRRSSDNSINVFEFLVHSLNLTNQFFQSNFYFLVIKSIILHKKFISKIKNPRFYIIFSPIYLILVSFASHLCYSKKVDPYALILSLNGGTGFIINILIPAILYIKLSNEKLLSIKVVSFVTFVYLYCCSLLTSFYMAILEIMNQIIKSK